MSEPIQRQTTRGYWYLITLPLLAIGCSVYLAVLCWSFNIWLLFWAVALAGGYGLWTVIALLYHRGYCPARLFPLLAIPLWIPALLFIGGMVGLFANGMEGSRTDTPLETAIYLMISGIILLPFWLLFHLPFLRILRQPAVKTLQIATPIARSRRPAWYLSYLPLALALTILIAMLPVGSAGIRLIHVASQYGCTPVLFLLLHVGVPVDTRSRCDAYTPLHYAAEAGGVRCSALLIRHGARVNARTARGETPLLLAADYSHFDLAARLIADGADVRLADSDGETPLVAVIDQYPECIPLVEALLDHGADIDTLGNSQITLFGRAISNDDFPAARRWLARGASITPEVFFLANTWPAVEFLLARGVDINTRDAQGKTMLHHTVSMPYNLEIARELIRHGADVTATDIDGRTPLHLAAENDNYDPRDAARLLLAAGTDINARDNAGRSPLHYACRTYRDDARYIRFLLEHGADKQLVDQQGQTAVQYAEAFGASDTIAVLTSE